MKKLNILWMLIACLLFATSCSDDDEAVSTSLQVIKSDVSFTAVAATGSIEVQSTSAVTAASNQDWCTVSVSGNVITVAVPTYTGLVGRHAVVEISDAVGEKVRVPVSQAGGVWYVKGEDVYGFSDEEATVTIPVKSDYNYTVDMPDWMTGEKVRDGYNLTLKENTTGNARKGIVKFVSERGTKEIVFLQFGLNDIAGTYEATYETYGENDDLVEETTTFELVQDEEDNKVFYAVGLSSINGLVIPFSFNNETYQLSVSAGRYLGAITSRSWYFYTVLTSKAGYVHTDTKLSYSATAVLDLDDEIVMPAFPFKDEKGFNFTASTGTVKSYVDGLDVYVFKTESPSFANNNGLGYYDMFKNLSIKKIQPEE
ncbi:BACON domain-containing carbohydrate-binding protein [uncultured Bacteroides sp.]|jgi:hypothetical protein|uniref:BACON domain-containing protein n=1 Tax=uncultured Bacteroides sp. TaxID=162156 RepID=UPI0026044D08|nr:BACON domain-containing carbohydrate-binding protein [uncultured Bacteroides sp.]